MKSNTRVVLIVGNILLWLSHYLNDIRNISPMYNGMCLRQTYMYLYTPNWPFDLFMTYNLQNSQLGIKIFLSLLKQFIKLVKMSRLELKINM